jgi:flagellar hook assembly protein FlgD
MQNAPNPSSGFTVIRYSVPAKTQVTLTLYDMQGRLVRVLVKGTREAGEHSLEVDTRNLGKGMYFYRMSADGFSSSKRLIVE